MWTNILMKLLPVSIGLLEVKASREVTQLVQLRDLSAEVLRTSKTSSDTMSTLTTMRGDFLSMVDTGLPKNATPFIKPMKDALQSIKAEIVKEKTHHVTFHDNLYSAFKQNAKTYNDSIAAGAALATDTSDAKTLHGQCRDQESTDFNETVVCAGQLANIQEIHSDHKLAVTKALDAAKACEDVEVYTTGNVTALQQYQRAVQLVLGSRIDLDAKIQECEQLNEELDEKRTSCDKLQTQYEQRACAYAVSVQTAVKVYQGQYSQAVAAFENEFPVWQEQSGDRKVQCELVDLLICYAEALETHDDTTPLQEAFDACGKKDYNCHGVTFEHKTTPNPVQVAGIPQAPCQGDFDHGVFPEHTSPGECEVCHAITTPCSNTCSGNGNAAGTIVEDNCGCVCEYGFDGIECENETPCSNTCSNHGQVTGTLAANNCFCNCDDGYQGDKCDIETPCPQEACSGNGEATGTTVAKNCECHCVHGYSGADCSTEDPCPNFCSGVGTATGTIAQNNCGCTCDDGYEGDECENVIACSTSTGHTCHSHGEHRGTIADDGDDCGCDCHTGWIGNECGTEQPCTNDCSSHGTAKGTIPQGNCGCDCDADWMGTACETEKPCENHVCNGHGTASGTVSRCTCTCHTGWTGTRCQEQIKSTIFCQANGNRYLKLLRDNWSEYRGGAGDHKGRGGTVTNWYKVRVQDFNAGGVTIDQSDSTFSCTSNPGDNSADRPLIEWGNANNCNNDHSKPGRFNVDLRGTPYTISSWKHPAAQGFWPYGSGITSDGSQKWTAECGGWCGYCGLGSDTATLVLATAIDFEDEAAAAMNPCDQPVCR